MKQFKTKSTLMGKMYKMDYQEKRIMFSDDLRKLCIEHNLYTKGNVTEYERFLRFAENSKNLNSDDFIFLAKNIYSHSETVMSIPCIAFLLVRISYSQFELIG